MVAVIQGGGDKEDDKRWFAVICSVFAVQLKYYQQHALDKLDLRLEALRAKSLGAVVEFGQNPLGTLLN